MQGRSWRSRRRPTSPFRHSERFLATGGREKPRALSNFTDSQRPRWSPLVVVIVAGAVVAAVCSAVDRVGSGTVPRRPDGQVGTLFSSSRPTGAVWRSSNLGDQPTGPSPSKLALVNPSAHLAPGTCPVRRQSLEATGPERVLVGEFKAAGSALEYVAWRRRLGAHTPHPGKGATRHPDSGRVWWSKRERDPDVSVEAQ